MLSNVNLHLYIESAIANVADQFNMVGADEVQARPYYLESALLSTLEPESAYIAVQLEPAYRACAASYDAEWRVSYPDKLRRVALMVEGSTNNRLLYD